MATIRVFHVLASDAVGGGADEHTLLLCRDQERLGLQVGLVALEGPIMEEVRRRYGWPTFPFHRWPTRRNISELAAIFRSEKPDVVHTHKPFADLVACKAAQQAGVPAILATLHVRLNTERALRGRLWVVLPLSLVRSHVLRRIPQRIVAVSEATRQDALRKLRIGPERIVTVHNGTDPERYRRLESFDRKALRRELGCPPGGKLIGITARVEPVKGYHMLLSALPAILAAEPQARIAFVGRTDNRKYVAELQQQVRALGVAERVCLAGLRRDMPEVLNALDLFVLPSTVEGLSRAVLEALACETPVLATRTDGNCEALADGLNARLIEPDDPAGLARTAIEMLRNPELCRRLAAEGRRTVVERFNAIDAARRQLALYEEVLRARRG